MPEFNWFLNHDWKEYLAVGRADRYCQRIVKNDEGDKLYFINAEEWQLNKLCSKVKTQIVCKAYFYMNDEIWFVTTLHRCDELTIAQIEEFFQSMYKNMGCIPSINNN